MLSWARSVTWYHSGMSDAFYITTPIYYVNGEPHLGSTYTTTLADALTRYHRLYGEDCRFLTGTDEHGSKIATLAAANGESPEALADRVSAIFRATWPRFEIAPDDFIRTTEERHKRVVQKILQDVYDAGDIYFGEYSGLYCVGCERFYTEKELVDGRCPQHGTVPDEIRESNYFFRMGRYQDWLVNLLTEQPEIVRPDAYRRELLAFLREPLEDLCISRPKSRLTWGITLPFDEDYVTYVWFDALINYVSALDYPDGELYARYWPSAQHLVAKDILKPHGIYWPCMLQSAGIPMYRHLNVHGYWTIGGFKGSKSDRAELQEEERQEALRLFRDPMAIAELLSVDGMRYCLLREMAFGSDLDFTRDLLVTRYNADLAHDLGNVANRTVAMITRYCEGRVPDSNVELDVDRDLRDAATAAPARVWAHILAMEPHLALAEAMGLAQMVNRYYETKKPWAAHKAGDTEGVATTLYYAAEALGIAASLLLPAMPSKMMELRRALGLGDQPPSAAGGWGYLEPGTPVAAEARLFPAIER